MKTRTLGSSGISVNAIGFGAWQLNNPLWGGPDRRESLRLVEAALAAGCNFFDTAPNYGDGASENLLGEALKGRRGEAVICSKFGHGSPDGDDFSVIGLKQSLEGSLRRLQTDYLDVLLVHNPPPELLDGQQSADLYAAFENLKKEGKLRVYGASIDSSNELDKLAGTTPSGAAEVLFNAFLQEARMAFPPAASRGMGLIAKVPLDSGWLSGRYNETSSFTGIRDRWTAGDIARRARLVRKLRALLPPGMPMAQAALAFILAHPEISTVIPGAKSIEQLRANLSAAGEPLAPEVVSAIHTLWETEIKESPLPW